MIRKIIKIDQDRCNGCGLCAEACHEEAIGMKDGKAVLLRDDYCDGLGDCLPVCPVDAISFEEREAAEYNEAEVKRNMARKKQQATGGEIQSELRQWPVQIKLVPENAPYFKDADLLIAADCTAFAYGEFQRQFLKGRALLVGCPKLDAVDYTEKLAAVISNNDIRSITVLRMEVPCCGGIEFAAKEALKKSGKEIPIKIETVSVEGDLIS